MIRFDDEKCDCNCVANHEGENCDDCDQLWYEDCSRWGGELRAHQLEIVSKVWIWISCKIVLFILCNWYLYLSLFLHLCAFEYLYLCAFEYLYLCAFEYLYLLLLCPPLSPVPTVADQIHKYLFPNYLFFWQSTFTTILRLNSLVILVSRNNGRHFLVVFVWCDRLQLGTKRLSETTRSPAVWLWLITRRN